MLTFLSYLICTKLENSSSGVNFGIKSLDSRWIVFVPVSILYELARNLVGASWQPN
jgi:hypothetical protein